VAKLDKHHVYHQGSSDHPGAKFPKGQISGDVKDLMSGPTGDSGGLGAEASGQAESPFGSPGTSFRASPEIVLCQRAISGREPVFTVARQTRQESKDRAGQAFGSLANMDKGSPFIATGNNGELAKHSWSA
jgi:hypothetical protein